MCVPDGVETRPRPIRAATVAETPDTGLVAGLLGSGGLDLGLLGLDERVHSYGVVLEAVDVGEIGFLDRKLRLHGCELSRELSVLILHLVNLRLGLIIVRPQSL